MPPVLLSAELPEIQQRGYLRVAVKDNLPLFGQRTATGSLEGFEIDLAERLAQELVGSTSAVELHPVTNQERLTRLLQDDVDLVIARLSATAGRSRLVDFSEPYYLDGTALVTRSASVQRLADLRAQRIAVLAGADTIAIVRARLPRATLVEVPSYAAALTLLESGQAEAFAADASVLSGWVHDYPDYRLLPDRLSGEALAIAMPRGLQYASLRQQVNQAIARWKQEGWLQERQRHWGLTD